MNGRWIQTEAGEILPQGEERQVPTVRQGTVGILRVVDGATKEKLSGHILVI